MPLNLAMLISADASRAKPVLEDTRKGVQGVRVAVEENTRSLARMQAANDAADSARSRGIATIHGETMAHQRLMNAAMGSSTAGSRGAALAAHEVQNLSFQLNDVAMMLAAGQSPFQLMMQQGTQVSQILGRRGLGQILPALGQGLMSLLSPANMVLAGITAAGYAGYYAFQSIQPEVKALDSILEDHDRLLKRIRDRYPELGRRATDYAKESAKVLQADTADQIKAERDAIDAKSRELISDILSRPASDFGDTSPLIAAFREAVSDLERDVESGTPGLLRFKDAMADIRTAANATDAQKALALELSNLADEGAGAERKLAELTGTVGDNGDALKQSRRYVDDYVEALRELGELAKPELSDRDTADRAFDRARDRAGDWKDGLAAARAYEQALKRIADAQDAARMQETGGHPVARPNLEDTLPNAQDVLRSQEERLEMLRLEAQTIGVSEAMRARLIAALEAEQEIRRRGIAIQGEEANSIRANALAIADAETQIDRAADAWDRFRSTGENAIDTLLDKVLDGDLGGALAAIGKDFAKLMLEMPVGHPMTKPGWMTTP